MAFFAPFPFIFYPVTAYSIGYDIYTNANEHDAPNGWNARRSRIYYRLKQRFTQAGFARDQYSDFVNLHTTAIHTYNTMLQLTTIPPPHKLSSTVRRLRMGRLDDIANMDVTAIVQLGGMFANTLQAPVPANLVIPVAWALFPQPGPVPPGFILPPVDSRAGGASNPANFLF